MPRCNRVDPVGQTPSSPVQKGMMRRSCSASRKTNKDHTGRFVTVASRHEHG
ncbi:hypothetical protein BJX66DRAFT_317014 [Aspergillus keveii]|uniref:Uncharacterized protein n=1 Tax=Aspergillus keveii TaxID=714993 RepID=A0ABR4FMC4_9EURO